MFSPIPKKAYMYGMTDNVNYPLETSPPPAYSELQPYVPPQVSTFDMNDVHEALPQVSKGKTKCFQTWANDEVRRETDWDADLRLARYIFEEFKYDENLIPRDVADCLRVYSLFSPGPDGQIKQIDNFVGHKALKRFYKTNATCGDSWSIHLHGNGSEVAVNPNGITTFSYIAALVTRKLTTAPGHFVLTWFCAKLDCHSAERYRPKAMMASLLCQLLDKMTKAGLKLNLRTSPFVQEWEWSQLQERDMGTLCRVFTRLVNKLSRTKVFCILDEVTMCEHLRLAEDLDMALETLKWLSTKSARGGTGVLKLMVTDQVIPSQVTCFGFQDTVYCGQQLEWKQYYAGYHVPQEPAWLRDL